MVRSSTRDSCTNQSECRSTQEEVGATESCTNQSGGQGPYSIGEATDSCRSTQEGDGTRELPTNSENVHTGPEKKRRCKERHGTTDSKG